MGRVFCGLSLVMALSTTAWAGDIQIQNKASQPFVYQVRYSGDDAWSDSLSLPVGKRHGYSTDTRLVVRFESGRGSTTAVLTSGGRFRYQQDADGNGELVNVRFDSPDRPKTRQVTVLAVADDTYRRTYSNWKDRIAEIVATASNYFDESFAIRLRLVGCSPWKFEATAGGNSGRLLDDLLEIESPQADLVIGWIAAAQSAPGMAGWYAHSWYSPFGRHILIADLEQRLLFGAAQQLIHCVASTFGAFHVTDRKSIMQKTLENVPYPFEFGDAARQVILLTREFDFQAGVTSLKPESVRQIRELYQKHHHPDEPPSADPISQAARR